MKQRIMQFFYGLTAKLCAHDHVFIRRFLDEEEQVLFYGMDVVDQRHALYTAYTALELARGKDGVDGMFLVRIALLHDIGRMKGDLGLWGKVFAVLMHDFSPRLAQRCAHPAKEGCLAFFRRALYVYYHHAEVGSEKLLRLGHAKEAAAVRLHHKPASSSDSIELCLLRKADSMN